MSGHDSDQIALNPALLDDRVGQIHRGLGVVVRWGQLALVIPSDSAHDAVVDKMLNELGTMPKAKAVSDMIDELLTAGRLKSVALLLGTGDTYSAMAFGSTEILADGEVIVAGSTDTAAHEIAITTERITMRASKLAKAAEPVAPYDLRRGIAPGAGLTLRLVKNPTQMPQDLITGGDSLAAQEMSPAPEGRPVDPRPAPTQGPGPKPSEAPKPRSQPKSETSVGVTSIPLTGEGFDPNDRLPPLAPLPLPAEQDSTMDLPDVTVSLRLEGILCARNHFNNPSNTNCMVCGLSLAHLRDERVRGPRPTLGFIVFDDGATFGLNRSYVIGREPQSSAEVGSEALVVRTDNETLSRTHAELRLVDWQVQLIDRGSTNGTYIWNPESQEWYQLTADMPVELRSGATVALGRRTFVFEGVGHTSL